MAVTTSSAIMPVKRHSTAQRELFDAAPVLPEGFAYREDVLSKAEERDYVRAFETLPFKPFEFHGYLGNRRVVYFGSQYDYAAQILRDCAEPPSFLDPLRALAAHIADVPATSLSQALVTEYAPGSGIGWHRDRPMFEDVVAFSFVSPCRLRFRRKEGDGWARAAIEVAPRSAYALRGPARWDWYHGIPAVEALRYSVTFRNFVPDRAKRKPG